MMRENENCNLIIIKINKLKIENWKENPDYWIIKIKKINGSKKPIKDEISLHIAVENWLLLLLFHFQGR